MNNIFCPENIFFLSDHIQSKEQLFKQVARKAYQLGYVTSEQRAYKGLLDRELQQTTGFQNGFAIPHCKSSVVKEPKLMIFRTDPIQWDSLDGEPIDFSFVLLIPEQAIEEHLQYLARIARSLIDEEYRQQLKTMDANSLFKAISERLGV